MGAQQMGNNPRIVPVEREVRSELKSHVVEVAKNRNSTKLD